MQIETESDSMIYSSSVATGILHFGYRWVSDNMLIGDLVGLGLWLAYAEPLSINTEITDPSGFYSEPDYSSHIYGGMSLDLGWMF